MTNVTKTSYWNDAVMIAQCFTAQKTQDAIRLYGNLRLEPLALANKLAALFTPEERIRVTEWITLSEKIKSKFDVSQLLLCDRLAYEQSTGRLLSDWKSRLWPANVTIADLCCGMGGDSLFLPDTHSVIGIDLDPFRLIMFKTNGELLNKKMFTIQADALTFPTRATYAHIDPARRNDRNQNQRKLELTPSWEQVQSIASHYTGLMVKLPPAFPDELVPATSHQLFLGSSKDCLEILLLLGEWSHLSFKENCCAVHADTGDMYSADRTSIPESLDTGTGCIIWEPSPVMIRSHLYRHWGKCHGLSQLDRSVAYLTGNTIIHEPWARGYRVIDSCTMHQSTIRSMLRKHDIGNLIIKKRGVDIDPDTEIR
ncbi:MAG: class I SAM-dependent methyltransferase, partial [Fibrobacterota bacterium]|nr:class I SAM-dependent methyltransferase [Chitinispirillaceae bacterium]